MKNFIEQNCCIEHEGKRFYAAGASVTSERIVAYPKANGILGDWHGNTIGTWCAVASWHTPRSFVSRHMYQIEARVDGVLYTGRGAGEGRAYVGRRKARQS